MKKNIMLLMIPLMVVLLMASCNKNAEVKQLLADLATAVNASDKATIEKIYPDASKADSLTLSFNAENVQIEELPSGGWRVILGEGKDLVAVKNDADGALSIKESHGVFAIPQAKMNFAIGTGLVKKDMNDAEIATQLADTAFIAWVSEKFMKTFNEKFRITSVRNNQRDYGSDGTGGGEWFITVSNNLDIDVVGTDYSVTMTSPVNRKKVVTMEGEDIFAGGSAQLKSGFMNDHFYVKYDWYGCPDVKEPVIKLKFNLSSAELLEKYFFPQGDEYENYLKTK